MLITMTLVSYISGLLFRVEMLGFMSKYMYNFCTNITAISR